jgi:opacity protein-like surface antigen
MKKIVLSAVAVFAFGFINAQDVKFGAKVGLNVSSISGESDSKSKVGLALGVFTEIKVSDKFSVQPELLYSVLGAKSNASSDNISLAYFNIPVMAKYYVADKFSLEAGPQIGFLSSAKYVQGSNSANIKDSYKSADFGLNFGAGYDLTKNISAGVRYTVGLSNISSVVDTKNKNNNIAIALAYKF